ncbi:putative PIG3 family NAD(P)H quinone oxidoreductase [Plasticicumulans lactativorans]|uniref:Putative PIG3 family NAD(P)H quinone oxidoreductase n=1 Tax=Plasticicumulans lactativorans TaxID=1133106 RepID=A0A4R2L025_9GAMM|nr:NAD(P)H-quinone oxidoreductase [Plasticicumulans lactativorans]TCO79563.1 putative PIG3 family NAD(P)H quinone oxidoreductase [Plasticicumulans lactativorans]
MTLLPATMPAVEIREPGGPEVLRLTTRPLPVPGPGEVLIRVAAAGVNRPDCLQRQGLYPPPPGASELPGLEVAGEIVALGPDAGGWAPGARVCALLAGGGYAGYASAPAGQCLPWPDGLSAAEAAALPETAFTVWTNVFQRGHLAPGETLLVHGGTSGIGTLAIQLASALGARVLATAGGPDKVAACVRLGAARAIDYRSEDFVEVARACTGGAGVDVILDMVGGDYTARNLDALAVDGRLVQIAFLRGPRVALDLRPIMQKRLTLTGSTLRGRSVAEKAAIAAELRARVWPLVASGRVRPLLDGIYPLAEAAAAHARMESSAHIGKLVLVPDAAG